MTDSTKTLIAVLLDRSGSMQAVKTDTEGGFNAFIREQRAQIGVGTASVTLAQFDHEYELVYADVPLAEVPPLCLVPRGTTALYDGIGKLSTDVGAKLAAMPEDQRPGTVIVVVLTDGHENASREWTHKAVQALIGEQQDRWGWMYLFLGATLDAVDVAAGMGIPQGNAVAYAAASTEATFGVLSRATSNARRGTGFAGFSDEDRRTAAGDGPPVSG